MSQPSGFGSAEPAVLACRNLRRSYGTRRVLAGLDLEVARGEFVCVIGRSGAGKSTLLRILAGLDDAFTGEVRIVDRIAVMFQDARLLPWQRVGVNVTLGLRGSNARAVAEAGAAALGEVGLRSRDRAWPRELSGGELQRVAIARALVRNPEMLLLDEPFAALDALTRIDMQALLAGVVAVHGAAVLLVTHDVDEAIVLADRVLTLDHGRVISDLPVELPRPRERTSRGFVALREDLLHSLHSPHRPDADMEGSAPLERGFGD